MQGFIVLAHLEHHGGSLSEDLHVSVHIDLLNQ